MSLKGRAAHAGPVLLSAHIKSSLVVPSLLMYAERFLTKGTAYGPKKGMQLVRTVPTSPLPWEWPQPNATAGAASKQKSSSSSKIADMVIVLVVQDGRQPRYLEAYFSISVPSTLIIYLKEYRTVFKYCREID